MKNAANRAVYNFRTKIGDKATQLDQSAVYGSPELHKDEIADAQLVANPGCYATSIILALAAWTNDGLIDLDFGVICDSKSGVSGAGKQPTPTTHFVEAADNLSAYNVFGHRHTGEMLEQLGLCKRANCSSRRTCCRFLAAFCPPSTFARRPAWMQPRSKAA